MRFVTCRGVGAQVFKEGSLSAGQYGNGRLSEMECFIVIKGRVEVKQLLLMQNLSLSTVVGRYNDIDWVKTNNQNLKRIVEGILAQSRDLSKEKSQTYDDIWINETKVIEPVGVFGDKVLTQPEARSSTATCLDSYTELLCLSYETYHSCVDKAIKKDLSSRVAFLRQMRIFQNMTYTQLERLLLFLEPVKMDYNKVLYRAGDAASGIYLIQSGSFEITVPSSLAQTAQEAAQEGRPGVKHFILKKNSVQQDRSLMNVNLVILERGEVLGLEECESRGYPKPRRQTVTCKQNNSTLLFLKHEVFVTRVLSDWESNRDVMYENILKTVFNQQRQMQKERTVWKAKNILAGEHTSQDGDSQVRDSVDGVEMQTASDYIKQKISTEYENIVISLQHDRELRDLIRRNPSQEDLQIKNIEIQKIFSSDVMMGQLHHLKQSPSIQRVLRQSPTAQELANQQSQSSIAHQSSYKLLHGHMQSQERLNLLKRAFDVPPQSVLAETEQFVLHDRHFETAIPEVRDEYQLSSIVLTSIDKLSPYKVYKDGEDRPTSIPSLDEEDNAMYGKKALNKNFFKGKKGKKRNKMSGFGDTDDGFVEIKVAKKPEVPVQLTESSWNTKQESSQEQSEGFKLAFLAKPVTAGEVKIEPSEGDSQNFEVSVPVAVPTLEIAQEVLYEEEPPVKLSDLLNFPFQKQKFNPSLVVLPKKPSENVNVLISKVQDEKQTDFHKSYPIQAIHDLPTNKRRSSLQIDTEIASSNLDKRKVVSPKVKTPFKNETTVVEAPSTLERQSQASSKLRLQKQKSIHFPPIFPETSTSKNYLQSQKNLRALRQHHSTLVHESTPLVAKKNSFVPTAVHQRSKAHQTNAHLSRSPSKLLNQDISHTEFVSDYQELLPKTKNSGTISKPSGEGYLQQRRYSHSNYSSNQRLLEQPSMANLSIATQPMEDHPYQIAPNNQLQILSPQAARAATELIQHFLMSPNQQVSAQDFLMIQSKYNLEPKEAHQLLVQQIDFQRTFEQPTSAQTVVKMSHETYQSHIRTKRQEVIQFRNELMQRFTNPLAKINKHKDFKRLQQLKRKRGSVPMHSHTIRNQSTQLSDGHSRLVRESTQYIE